MNKTTFYIVCSLLLLYTHRIIAQPEAPTRLLRIYEDNDYLNLAEKGTDRAYTHGLRFELFYEKKKRSLLRLDDWLPKAGQYSTNIYGWALMQMMFTPKDLNNPNFQAGDYPYSGVLFLSHSLISCNSIKKYSIRTEMLAGVRGPASLAEQSQILIHRITVDQKPKGWQNHLNTKLLFNLNLTAEKHFVRAGNLVEILAGASLATGTLTNAVSVYPIIRLGRMTPYFQGLFSQFSGGFSAARKFQCYLFIKPKISLIASNALMHGQIQSSPETLRKDSPPETAPVKHLIAETAYGLAIVAGNISISYTQKPTTAYTRAMYSHNTGNISLHVSW